MTTHHAGGTRRPLVLAAMIFAVAMTFIDQTIVSIAAPTVQHDLGLSNTGVQWAVNSYLLTLAAFFALGGRLADTLGRRTTVTIGIVVFAAASALCGLTPSGDIAEAWLIVCRALQGVGGALMYPAALAIVLDAYSVNERGRALALFFGIAGGLTAVGPILGGYLTEWTWRAIFWINVPIALIALALLAAARVESTRRPARLDVRGVVLVAFGVGLSVFGFQQSGRWGWSNPLTGICVAVGIALLVIMARLSLRTDAPLIDLTIFRNRGFLVDNVVLALSMTVFVPLFFFASIYAQVSLGKSPTDASIVLLYFFIGFVVAAQIGGKMLDEEGAKKPLLLGSALSCFALGWWAQRTTELSLDAVEWPIILTGAGLGLVLGQANTDALNRVDSSAYGEATGITQTVRNYAASLGLAVLGSVLVSTLQSKLAGSFRDRGLSASQASARAHDAAQLSPRKGTGAADAIPRFVRLDLAEANRTILYAMAAIMAISLITTLLFLPNDRVKPAELESAQQQ